MSYSPVREELKRGWRELRGQDASPARLALAVAIGLFVGSLPIFGCHLPILLGLCLWLHLDGAVAYLAANVSNPLFAAALLTGEVEVGAFVRTGVRAPPPHAVSAAEMGMYAGDLAIGAPLVALGLALLGGGVTWGLVAILRRVRPAKQAAKYELPVDAPPWVKAVERVAARYVTEGAQTPRDRTRFHYVRTKLLGDPVAKMIAELEGERGLGAIVDVGTGRGQLPILLLELGRATEAVGFDWDGAKIADARAAAARAPALEARFFPGDFREVELPEADTILMCDVLHYVDLAAQDRALDAAARAVRPGGRVVVREADTERGWRSAATWLEERVFTFLRFNRGERVALRPAREIAARLEAAGLVCEVMPAWGRTPFANVILVGRRAAA